MTTDRDAGPTVQIRDNSYPVPTESLELGGTEVVPDELVRDLLNMEWSETERANRPRVEVRNDALQADLRRSDWLIVEVTSYDEQPDGHRHEYAKIEVSVDIEVRTIKSRQRLWSLMGEVRRIIYKWMLAAQPYHCIYWDGFTPDYTAGPNNFDGHCHIRLTADAQPIFTRRVTGEEAPNTDPDLFPEGI